MTNIGVEPALKRAALVARLRDLDGIERVRAAARQCAAERDADSVDDPLRADWGLRRTIEVAGWSAGCVGFDHLSEEDCAAVVGAARTEMKLAGFDLSSVDLSDATTKRLASLAIREAVDEEPPLSAEPASVHLAQADADAHVEGWIADHGGAVQGERLEAACGLAASLVARHALSGEMAALVAAVAFQRAKIDLGENGLWEIERALRVHAARAAPRRFVPPDPTKLAERNARLAARRAESASFFRAIGEGSPDESGRAAAKWAWAEAREERLEAELVAEWERVQSASHVAGLDVESEPGLLGNLARWSLSSAFRPVQEFAIPSALAVLATVFGRRFVTPTGAGLNLYMVALAGTGVGKEDLLKAPQTILGKANLGHLLGPGDFTSDSAIEATVRAHPSVFVPMDEFGQFVQAVQGRNAPAFARLSRKALLELFSKSGLEGRWTGKQKAADGVDKASDPIYSPTLTLLGCSTIDGFFEGLTEANFTDGFINRLIVVRGGRPGPRNTAHTRLTPPPALVEALKGMCEASTASEGNLCAAAARHAGMRPTLRAVPWADDEAAAAWEEVCAWQDVAEEAGRSGTAARAAENTLKVATIRALARTPGAPAVTAEDVRWAWRFIEASIETVEEGARQNMAGSEFEAAVKAIERAVLSAGPEGITRADLDKTRGVSKLPDRMIDEALKRLERGERIVQGVVKVPGKPGRPRLRIISTTFTGTVD